MKAIVCDKCQEVITDKELIDEVVTLGFYAAKLGEFDEVHLCESCLGLFGDWLESE